MGTTRKRRKEESGVVLVDILLAVLVLGIAALYFVDARSNTIRTAQSTAKLRIARMLATLKMEEVLLNEVSKESSETDAYGTFDEQGYESYDFEIDVEDVLISSEEDLEDPEKSEKYVRRVTVTVTYEGERASQESFSLTTILPQLEEEGGQ